MNIGISFKSNNTQELTEPKLASNTQEQDKIGIYKLMCNTCQTLYIGQISRSLKQRYQKHVKIYMASINLCVIHAKRYILDK
jgi:hypothetical protein